ncbi:MAG: type II secretion system protein [Deltaproteobacteria bacterium]|nr:type II secretion system protein [Deltaproteobacteria bacterium]
MGDMKNAGFSLVEVLVVCAILGVVALGISQMMIGQARQQANIQRKTNFQQLVMVTQAAVSSPAAILTSSSVMVAPPESDTNCGNPPVSCAPGFTCVKGSCQAGGGGGVGVGVGVGGGVK